MFELEGCFKDLGHADDLIVWAFSNVGMKCSMKTQCARITGYLVVRD